MKMRFLIEDCVGVWEVSDLIAIYNNKDKKGVENVWYNEFKSLEKELKNTVLKEVDRERLNWMMDDASNFNSLQEGLVV